MEEGGNIMNMSNSLRKLLISAMLGSGTLLVAQQPSTQDAPPAADNTKTNQRDQDPNQPTADQQKNNASDQEITQKIRKAIMNDKALSTYAHNVKVITQNGQVTLKGPVRSDDEKQSIEAKAAEIAGQNNVISALEVKAKP